MLLAHALGFTQSDLIRNPGQQIDTTIYERLLVRRIGHEPVALIVGRREFWSMEFMVSPASIIPRPDSETLIEAAVAAFGDRRQPTKIIDLGTGTGCLLLALLQEFPTAFGIGVDLAPDAAALAKANATQLGLRSRSAFLVGDWTEAFSGSFDLVISNPPYIPGPEVATLMPEVAHYEPRLALDGGPDGYDAHRTILSDLNRLLEPNGIAILELGRGQANYVSYLAREAGFQASFRMDLAEIPRAIVLNRPNY
ncbi:MAG: release factor glutamine methyltransferase [Acetobacteraceae bacterium]|nr:release factor glutamine methyltransferase [Acetobacteraceae bacterium]